MTFVPLVQSLRPKQMIKNLLVLAAPAAAGVLPEARSLWRTALAFIVFCLLSGGIYLVNDLRDAPLDRKHPTKRHRPIAAGELSPRIATLAAGGLLVGGLVLAALVNTDLALLGALFVANSLIYSLWLKRVAVLDIVLISAGFVIRAVAGAVSVDIAISSWFLFVAMFGSLFLAASKRSSEIAALGTDSETRSVLEHYSASFLTQVQTIAVSLTLVGYTLWTTEHGNETGAGETWLALSIGPFLLGLLRYLLSASKGPVEAPESAIFEDPVLLGAVGLWGVLFMLGVG